ncbi:MAG: glycine zipper family protein [Bacteroidales bacterium]|jgi:hypothetical protein|nr:glycine zipper family protein [Bacteroidales bacterium]
MKKIFFNLLGIAVIAIIAITSCQKPDEVINSNLKKMSFESFEKYGKMHNDFLSHFKNEFVINPDITKLSEGIDYITQFYINYAMELEIGTDEKNTLIKSLEDYKRFLYTPEFYNELFVSEDSSGLYFESIKQAHNLRIIDDFEFNRMNLIGQKAKDNHDGLISYEELKNIILQIKNEWIAQGYSIESDKGHALAITLAISLASIEWWEENPDAYDDNQKNTKALPAWAGADIVGAGYGAAVSAISSYTTTGEVNWEAVGIGAVSGAVSGSTGIIGKAGKWLSNLFK